MMEESIAQGSPTFLILVAIAGPVLLGIGLKARRFVTGRALLVVSTAAFTAFPAVLLYTAHGMSNSRPFATVPLCAHVEGRHAITLLPLRGSGVEWVRIDLSRKADAAVSPGLSSDVLRSANFRLRGVPPAFDKPGMTYSGSSVPLSEGEELRRPITLEYEVTKELRPTLANCVVRIWPLKGAFAGTRHRMIMIWSTVGLCLLWAIIGLVAEIRRGRGGGKAEAKA